MDSILITLLGKIQVYIFHFASIVIKRLETMLWLPDDGSQLGLYVPLGLLETGVGVGLKIVFWIGDIPEEKKYELLFEIYIFTHIGLLTVFTSSGNTKPDSTIAFNLASVGT